MDKKLEEIISRIVTQIAPTKIYLFGSHARGDFSPESDYDLVLIYDGEKSKRETSVAVHKLFKRPQFSLDLFVLTSEEFERFKHIANTLAREITENGVLVYG